MPDFTLIYADGNRVRYVVRTGRDADDIDRAASLGIAECPDGMYLAAVLQDDVLSESQDFPSEIRAAGEEIRIRARGADDGRAAGSWVVDGNTSDETCRAILQGIEDGDPETLDYLPAPRTGGEYADDPTWSQILEEEECDDSDDGRADLFDVYCEAFQSAVEDRVSRDCRAVVSRADAVFARFDPDRRYRVAGGPAVAWRVIRGTSSGTVVAVMVGDDSEHEHDPDDLAEIRDEDYCAECGQIGCTADGREHD